LTSVRLAAVGNKFFAPFTVGDEYSLSLHALVDTGSTVTAVRGDICRALSLSSAGERPVTCIHESHADEMLQRYFCTIDLGGRARRTVVYELGRRGGDGKAIDAILGLDMLEDCRMALDWVRMEGALEV